eukprot:Em0006g987a
MSDESVQKCREEREAKAAVALRKKERAEGIAEKWGLPWPPLGQWGRISNEFLKKQQLYATIQRIVEGREQEPEIPPHKTCILPKWQASDAFNSLYLEEANDKAPQTSEPPQKKRGPKPSGECGVVPKSKTNNTKVPYSLLCLLAGMIVAQYNAGFPLSSTLLMPMVLGFFEVHKISWVPSKVRYRRFLLKIGLKYRAITKTSRSLPVDFTTIKRMFLRRVVFVVRVFLNIDETGVNLLPCQKRTWGPSWAKQISVAQEQLFRGVSQDQITFDLSLKSVKTPFVKWVYMTLNKISENEDIEERDTLDEEARALERQKELFVVKGGRSKDAAVAGLIEYTVVEGSSKRKRDEMIEETSGEDDNGEQGQRSRN